MVASERTLLERAVVTALAPLRKQAGGYCEFVGEYAGELGGVREEDDVADRLLGRVPAVLVATGDDRSEVTVPRRRARVDLALELMVISSHLRSAEARTQGVEIVPINPKADPGVYQMLADCRHLLMGRDLGVDGLGTLAPRSSGPAIRRPGFMAYSALYAIDYRHEQLPLGEELPLEAVEHRHNLEDSETVNPVLVGEVVDG